MNILVGNTGFVGSNIFRNGQFDAGFDHTNIEQAYGLNPDLLIYAGVPAVKYLANQDREADFALIQQAFDNIQKINPKQLVLISSVDVYKDSFQKDEDTVMDKDGMEAYGLNRLLLEEMVREHYENALIVRLPALFGANIKKNFIYDLLNPAPSMLNEAKFNELSAKIDFLSECYQKQPNGFYQLQKIKASLKERLIQELSNNNFSALNFTDSRASYQFYNLDYLFNHITLALDNQIKVLNIATEPITAAEVYEYLYGKQFVNHITDHPANYNFKTKHSAVFGSDDGYILKRDQILSDIKYFVHPLKLAISNIGFSETFDYRELEQYNGLEIAPSKIAVDPYAHQDNIAEYAEKMMNEFDLPIVSMQSIWYQISEGIFTGGYDKLVALTKQAIDLADKINCRNIVFGSPKNRNMSNPAHDLEIAKRFFREIAEYAEAKQVIIALEPNPTIYQTNFINTTQEAFDFVKELNLPALKVNVDLGTIIYNREDLSVIKDNIHLVNHVHISEPNLEKIEKRQLHKELKKLLVDSGYNRYVSIEMKEQSNDDVIKTLRYVREIFAV